MRPLTRIAAKSPAVLALAVLVLAAFRPAAAGVFTDKSQFDAATTNQQTYNFDALDPTSSSAVPESSFVLVGPVGFGSTNPNLFAIGRDYASGAFAFGSANVVLQDYAIPSDVSAYMPSGGVTAFAVHLGLQPGSGAGSVTVTVDSGIGGSYSTIVPFSSLGFFGLTSTTPFFQVEFQSQDGGVTFADFTLADVRPVPEPSTLVLSATCGLLGFVALYRRRVRAS
jgi:hypothetical protein